MGGSCATCKFLYQHERGWSNWTVEETEVICALGRNPNLPAAMPWDWRFNATEDNWPATNESACDQFSAGEQVRLDVDGEVHPADETNDPETIAAVCASAGIEPGVR